MAATIAASKEGLDIIDMARKKKGWNKDESAWYQLALTSQATLKKILATNSNSTRSIYQYLPNCWS